MTDLKKNDRFPTELLRGLEGRMCIDGDGRTAPESLFDLVSSLGADGSDVPPEPAVKVGDLREDAVIPGAGRSLLGGVTEGGFAVTRFKLTSDTHE